MTPRQIAGRYELRDILGRGASGVVCEAIDRQIGRLVAVKLMPAPRGAADALAAIRPEAQAAGRLSHPHIVAIHDIGLHEDFVFIVMELVIGMPLATRMRQPPPLPAAEAVRIVVQALDALGHAHSRGVVHRDVKPANLLLVDDGWPGPPPVKLTDFGIARALPALRQAGAAPAQDLSGTPAYMAPEQFLLEAADHRADLWAAGIVLFELLAARKPFAGNPTQLAVKVAGEDAPSLAEARPDLPPASPPPSRARSGATPRNGSRPRRRWRRRCRRSRWTAGPARWRSRSMTTPRG